MTIKKTDPQYIEFVSNRMEKNSTTLFYHEEQSHYILSDMLFCLHIYFRGYALVAYCHYLEKMSWLNTTHLWF